ncbi:hypothetical protein KSP40_PGU011623 [Platanthera guangdongensis]|uniref:Uncharacterized protein n=1 Tax=Platanthera guangdongensis TaxID=2320717 RepID=A0ABR2LFL2_9ASPA
MAGVLIELSQFQSRSYSINHASDVASKLEQALEINLKNQDTIGSREMHKFLSHSSHNILRMHSLILQGQYSASNRH